MIPTLLALADGPAPSGGGPFGGGGAFMQLTPLLIMFLIFYFLLIRPQQKKQREHQEMLQKLQPGTDVVTTGGLIGKIKGINDKEGVVTLELQEKVRVRVLRSHIAGLAPSAGQPPSQEGSK